MPLDIRLQKDIGDRAGVITVKLTGSLNTATSAELEQQLAPVLAGQAHDIVFDLADLKFLSSAGLRVFASTRKTLKERGIRVSLIEPGWVGTDMSDEAPEKQQELQRKNELLKAEDIAASIAFCLAQPARCDIASMQVLAMKDD